MKFDVYCDESRPDLLDSVRPRAKYMVVGSLWLPTEERAGFKQQIHALRDRHRVGGEFKWQKISPSRVAFYSELIDWFISQGDRLRFRCIAVEQDKLQLVTFHESDQELGFYKFYYQLLHHWILDFNEYAIFCDFKRNRLRNRLHVLRRCLESANLSSTVGMVQAIRSQESVLIQAADVLTGVAAGRLNNDLRVGSTKFLVVTRLERSLGRQIAPTPKGEAKFNVFKIDLAGGW